MAAGFVEDNLHKSCVAKNGYVLGRKYAFVGFVVEAKHESFGERSNGELRDVNDKG
jgi:hypothetical protein